MAATKQVAPSTRAPTSPTTNKHLKRSRGESKGALLAWCMARQLEISLGFILLILLGNALSTPARLHLSTHYTPDASYHFSNRFHKFLFVSFRKPGTSLYYKGRDDAYVITWWVAMFWFLREALMRWVLEPIARKAGIREKRAIVRFTEQGYSFCYYTVFWFIGLYIMQTSDYRNFRTAEFWIGYPHDALPALTKWYYLVQTAFYIHQMIVLNLEERRKDHWQMFTHHVITTMLMSFSYVFNYTRVGNAILCTMDLVDIFLTFAKLLNYTGRAKAADVTFGIFLFIWILTRQIIFPLLLWSVYSELPSILPYDWRPREGYFNSRISHYTFCALLAALQVLLCIWFGLILRVVYKIVVGGESADDVRSDDEGGDDDDEEEEEDDEEEEREKIIIEGDVKPNGHANGAANGGAHANGGPPPRLERKKDR
ncbi:TLC domain-domain-containing protein [Leucosporidium creatinivorum]|uniref:TLC domain-domain-containing protein n=1 Tax=Leucosporidium creatinivorum TaxID=106004 RepID=A0A1Y2F3G9_9BASI|nr:TLC domain-domain-containing protein [Leucosporidium creatinivorum]